MQIPIAGIRVNICSKSVSHWFQWEICTVVHTATCGRFGKCDSEKKKLNGAYPNPKNHWHHLGFRVGCFRLHNLMCEHTHRGKGFWEPMLQVYRICAHPLIIVFYCYFSQRRHIFYKITLLICDFIYEKDSRCKWLVSNGLLCFWIL